MTPFPADNPYLTKGFEPVRCECECVDLPVEGEIPQQLSGSLYRIGPNPQFAPRGPYNPLLGDGMVHAFHIHAGRVSYRNRWVRTWQFQQERSAGRALFATSGNPRDCDPQVAGVVTDGVANTALVWHAGRLLALEEGHAPIEIHPDSLDTLGGWSFAGELPGNMSAHPKIDPQTGEMLFFANFPRRDFSGALELYVAEASGRLIRQQRITAPFAALVHDFAISRDFVIFFVCPLTLSLERLRSGRPPIAWEPQRQTWVGIVSRSSLTEVCWLKIRPVMVWHFINAFNEGEVICVDVCQQEAAAFAQVSGKTAEPDALRQLATRWTFRWGGSPCAAEQRLSEVVCEYPSVDGRSTGQSYRYAYVACGGGPGTPDLFHRALGAFDHVTGEMRVYRAGETCAVAEPLFVPRSERAQEGDGYLLSVVFEERRNASHLAIFDARRIDGGPIGRAFLDHRVPMGFHGLWKPRTPASAAIR